MQERFKRGFKVSSIIQLTVSPPEGEVNSAWRETGVLFSLVPTGFSASVLAVLVFAIPKEWIAKAGAEDIPRYGGKCI